jgi:rhamnose utilization protein RhaD (predicted bifunctional aldolase and dehydrogenase)
MKDVRRGYNFSVINYFNLSDSLARVEDDDAMNNAIRNSLALSKYKRPSMETSFHTLLDKYVVHVHPVYLTLVLCLKESRNLIKELFPDLDYNYIEYASPGYHLYKSISTNSKHKVFFLENHGVIVSSDDMTHCVDLLHVINERAKHYVVSHWTVEKFDMSFADHPVDHYVFPDAAVFSREHIKPEILAAHNYITSVGKQIGELRYLSQDDVHFLQHMESEKYRMKI